MKAPWCLRWRNTLPRYREPPRMVRCPLNASAATILFGSFIVIVLFFTVTSVSASLTDNINCPVRYDASDATSRAAVSPQVVQGILISRVPLGVSSYEASFRVTRVQKKYRGAGRLKKNKIVSFTFKNPSFHRGNDCVVQANVFPRRKYFLFVSGAARRRDPLYPVAPPLLVTKKVKKRIKSVTCKDCALAPSVGRLLNGSVVRGQLVNLTCIFDGNPPPSITWAKNDVDIDPYVKGIRIRTRRRRTRKHDRYRKIRTRHRHYRSLPRRRHFKQIYKRRNKFDRTRVRVLSTLVIKSVNDADAGVYSCRGRSVLGEASSHASLSVVPPLDPGLIHPCPYDSYCLNGGTCMFFKLFGEFVCQCAEGFKGQRCQEKAVFYPSFGDPNCRGPISVTRSSKGVRCLRNQPLELWQILQQAIADYKLGAPWTTTLDKRLTPSVVASLHWYLTKGGSPNITSRPKPSQRTGTKSNVGTSYSNEIVSSDAHLKSTDRYGSSTLENPTLRIGQESSSSFSNMSHNWWKNADSEARFSLPRQPLKIGYGREMKPKRKFSGLILPTVQGPH